MVAAFCGRCGLRAEAEEAYCVACGTALRRAEAPRVAESSESEPAPSGDERIVLEHALKLLGSGEALTAHGVLTRLCDEHPQWAIPRAYLGIACLRLIRVADARDHCEAAIALAPDSFICRTKYAEFLAKLGFYDKAVAECDIALRLAAPGMQSELAARELREFCKTKAKGIFYRELVSPSRIRVRNLLPGRFQRPVTQPKPVERGL